MAGGFLGTCAVHHKRLYTKDGAKRTIRRLHSPAHMRRYRCETVPGYWHIGHLPGAVTTGRIDAKTYFSERYQTYARHRDTPIPEPGTGPTQGVREDPQGADGDPAAAGPEADGGGRRHDDEAEDQR